MGPSLGPHLNEISETGLIPGSLPSPALLSPMFSGVLIKIFGSLKFCNKLDDPEK